MTRTIIALWFILLATGALADSANHIFYTEWNYYSVSDSRIVRANADGSDAVTVLDGFRAGVGVKDLAVDSEGQKLYFANRSEALIERCNFDGSERDTVVTGAYAVGLALDIDGGKVYWSDYSYSNPRIRRANLDGTEIEDLATASSGCVLEGVVLNIAAGHIYWAERMDQQIWRANMSGGGAYMILQCWEGIGHPCGLAIAGGRLYWGGDNAIHSSELNGDDVQTVIADLPDSPRSVEIDTEADHIYWTTTSISSGFVQRANLNGSELTTLVSGTLASYGLALEFGNVTSVSELPSANFRLGNYPNPFNPNTTISFTLPEAGRTTLQVLALDGTLVNTLIDGWRAEGQYEVRRNGCSSDGHSLSSGVYLCRLVNGARVMTQRVALVR